MNQERHCLSVIDNLNERFMKALRKEIFLTKEIIERLEYVDGDGVEFEIYRDTKTNKHYNVEIEVVRYFECVEEIDEGKANILIEHRC